MNNKALVLASVLAGVASGSANAQISIAGTASGAYGSGGLSPSLSYTLQGAGNTLVFGTYIDATYTPSSLQFAGAPADGVVQNQRVTLAYFFNPAATGNVTFTLDAGNTNSVYFFYELSGVNTSVAANLGTGASITTTSANRFVTDFFGANNTLGAGVTPNTAGGSILTLSGAQGVDALGDTFGGSIVAGFAANSGPAGVTTLGWTGAGDPRGEVSAAFAAAVPEPGTLALLLGSLGALKLVRRRDS